MTPFERLDADLSRNRTHHRPPPDALSARADECARRRTRRRRSNPSPTAVGCASPGRSSPVNVREPPKALSFSPSKMKPVSRTSSSRPINFKNWRVLVTGEPFLFVEGETPKAGRGHSCPCPEDRATWGCLARHPEPRFPLRTDDNSTYNILIHDTPSLRFGSFRDPFFARTL